MPCRLSLIWNPWLEFIHCFDPNYFQYKLEKSTNFYFNFNTISISPYLDNCSRNRNTFQSLTILYLMKEKVDSLIQFNSSSHLNLKVGASLVLWTKFKTIINKECHTSFRTTTWRLMLISKKNKIIILLFRSVRENSKFCLRNDKHLHK